MTDGQVGLLVIFGALVFLLCRGKAKPRTIIVETFEVFHAPRRRMPGWLVNMAIVAGIGLFIWAMNR